MKLYCTSLTRGRQRSTEEPRPPRMLYLGLDKEEAEKFVPGIAKVSEEPPSETHPQLYCALPFAIKQTAIQYYISEGSSYSWWYSIIQFEIKGE